MEQELGIFHITWVTHSSRISDRMKKYGADNNLNPVILSLKQEIEITKYISIIVNDYDFKILSYNICANHVHLIIRCEECKRDNIIGKLKGKSAQLYKESNKINSEFHLWAQKYNYWTILEDDQLFNVIEYIKNNRVKHSLPVSAELEKVIVGMLTSFEELFD